MRVFLCSILVLIVILPVFAENLLVNGDFATGDLYGWKEAGPSTVTRWQGATPVPLQVFRDTAPMFVAEVYNSPDGTRHIRRAGMASSLSPREGYSAGWTLAGSPFMGYPWMSQTVRVAPGKYRLSASWDVLIHNGDQKGAAKQFGCAFMVNLDSDLNLYAPEGREVNVLVWDDESKGKWVRRTVSDHELETKTGYIEVRLQLRADRDAPIPVSEFVGVAVDNVQLDLVAASGN